VAHVEAIADGARGAVQIAVRCHILKNLYEAIERLLTRQHHKHPSYTSFIKIAGVQKHDILKK
jgi:hypothetical protein